MEFVTRRRFVKTKRGGIWVYLSTRQCREEKKLPVPNGSLLSFSMMMMLVVDGRVGRKAHD